MEPRLAWMALGLGLGAVVGSFIGLVSLRLPAGRPFIAGRSACPACERRLGAADLVPVLSYLALRGRCRTCGAAIPRRYLALEIGCALLGAWALAARPGAEGLAGAILAWQLLLLAVLDAEHFWLPRGLTLTLIVSGLAAAALMLGPHGLAEHALGAAIGFLAFAGLGIAYRRLRGREGLGGGDAYLLAGGGAWCGALALPTIVLAAALSGLAWVLVLRLTGRRVAADQRLPFGVFLAIGIWLAWLYGPLLVR